MSKPNLPPLPADVDMVRVLFRGQPEYFEPQNSYYTSNQMLAYAEEAVRQALAAQVPVAWMTDDGRVATDETKRTGMASTSRVNFNIPLAIIPETRDG